MNQPADNEEHIFLRIVQVHTRPDAERVLSSGEADVAVFESYCPRGDQSGRYTDGIDNWCHVIARTEEVATAIRASFNWSEVRPVGGIFPCFFAFGMHYEEIENQLNQLAVAPSSC